MAAPTTTGSSLASQWWAQYTHARSALSEVWESGRACQHVHTQRPPAHCSPAAGSVVSGSGGLRKREEEEAEKRAAAAACTTEPATVIRPRAGPRGTATNLGSSRVLPPHRFLRRAGCRRPRRCHGPGSPESRAPRVPAADSPLKDNGALSTLLGPALKSRGPANHHHTRPGGGLPRVDSQASTFPVPRVATG